MTQEEFIALAKAKQEEYERIRRFHRDLWWQAELEDFYTRKELDPKGKPLGGQGRGHLRQR